MPRIAPVSVLLLITGFIALSTAAVAREPVGLHDSLEQLTSDGKFSGAVVVRGADGIRFARGYGFADPFEGRLFTPDTPTDSGSLAKPITSTAILILEREGKVELDAPVKRYLPEYPHSSTTVRHLLSHSAGLALDESPEGLANKTNAALLGEAGAQDFTPGSAFAYCNLCSITLALLIERVTGRHYLEHVKESVGVPAEVRLRPQRLVDWEGRAIGYRRTPDGGLEHFDSWDGELLYGAANFSISAAELAQWGAEWWKSRLLPIRETATAPARIDGKKSGLTLGNWYCDRRGRRCHYLGHHEGFHHMLYWDADRQISLAMVSNNALDPALQQRLQRALIAFAAGAPETGRFELEKALPEMDVPVGRFELPSGEIIEIVESGEQRSVRRRGVSYAAYPVSRGIRYVPGLDVYVAGAPGSRLRWLSLYEDLQGIGESRRD